jgi:hypothetical protein
MNQGPESSLNTRVVKKMKRWRPYEECPWGGSDISVLVMGVNVGRNENG